MVDKLKNFTVENNVYKGELKRYVGNYESLGEMVWTKIKSHGDKIAHLDACTEKVVTYAELQDKVVKCALWLQKQGIKSGDVVSVCTSNHPNSIIPCLAATYINAIFNPWNEDMDMPTALHVLQLTMPKAIFCNEKSVNVILKAINEKKCNPTMVVFGKHPDAFSFLNILSDCNDAEVKNFRYTKLDDIKKTACIIHSSGTTGMPKGVEISNYVLLFISEDGNMTMVDAKSLWFLSLYGTSAVHLNLKAIAQGAKVVIYPTFDEEMTCRLIEKYKVTIVILSTSMMNRFVRAGYAKKYSLSSLKVIMVGGTIFKPKIQEALKGAIPHVDILQAYGMTEIGVLASIQLPHHKPGSCGTVAANVQLKLVDPESGKVVGPNQSGEVWIKSEMMNRYYKNPEATKDTIDEDDKLFQDGCTQVISGIDEDGELFIIDRIKELIKYRGYHISPGEIESVLMMHPAVLEAAVVAVPHPIDDEHPVAYITKKPNAKETEQELIDFVAKNMMDLYKLRAGVIFLEAFPYTGSGKIERKKLRAMAKKLAIE